MKTNGKILITVGLVFTGIGLLSNCGGKSAPDDPRGDLAGATDVCHQFVKDDLKSPASAQFTDQGGALKPTGHWIVNGLVDSQNSYGALLRAAWSCEVQHDHGETWNRIDVQLLPQG